MAAPITVILLNYDGGEVLLRCLRSFAALRERPARLLFVDNGSRNYDPSQVTALLGVGFEEALQFIRLEENTGYAKGMNQGLAAALADPVGDWVMTLSNDTELSPDFFQELSEMLRSIDAEIGMLGPKLRAMHDQDVLDGTGIGVCLDGMSTARGQREVDRRQYDAKTHILLPNGVSAIYRLKMLEDVGLLDETFWSYCEDTDLGLRGWLAGWECRFVPACVVYHARSMTLGEHSLSKLYYAERNHYWVAIKNFPLPLLVLNPVFSAYRYSIQAYALLSRRGQGRGYGQAHSAAALAAATLRGVLAAMRGVPHAFSQRLRLRSLKRRSTVEAIRALWDKRMRFDELILK